MNTEKRKGLTAVIAVMMAIVVALLGTMIYLLTREKEPEKTDSGYCGDEGKNVEWVLYDDGEIVISGEGAMENYTKESHAPWYKHRAVITSAKIEDGVTHIGDYAFMDCEHLAVIDIADSVETIGEGAFDGCDEDIEINWDKFEDESNSEPSSAATTTAAQTTGENAATKETTTQSETTTRKGDYARELYYDYIRRNIVLAHGGESITGALSALAEDFDDDGKTEMLLFYLDEANTHMHLELYTIRSGAVVLADSSDELPVLGDDVVSANNCALLDGKRVRICCCSYSQMGQLVSDYYSGFEIRNDTIVLCDYYSSQSDAYGDITYSEKKTGSTYASRSEYMSAVAGAGYKPSHPMHDLNSLDSNDDNHFYAFTNTLMAQDGKHTLTIVDFTGLQSNVE